MAKISNKAKSDTSKKGYKIISISEPLDILLHKNIINEKQHWAGMHLRWLHSIRFGIQNITSLKHYPFSIEIKQDNPEWREEREIEYSQAIYELKKYKLHDIISSMVIFGKIPKFLLIKNLMNINIIKSLSYANEVDDIKDGLDTLVELWMDDQKPLRPKKKPGFSKSSIKKLLNPL